MKTLRDRLKDWTDADETQYELGLCLGVISEDLDYTEGIAKMWVDHPLNRTLYNILDYLKIQGFVLCRYIKGKGMQYRWID